MTSPAQTSLARTALADKAPARKAPPASSPVQASADEALTPVVESVGFTLVEEDDVAFSISLCHEIHRIYGSYESGELDPDHSVHLGLSLTVQILATLANTVTKGMPAMRIEVASAQTREMMAVLFSEPLLPQKGRAGRRQLDGRCTRPVGPPLEATNPNAIPAPDRAPATLPTLPVPSAQAGTSAPVSSPSGPAAQPARTAHPDRLSRWFRARPLMVRILLGVLGCGVAAVLIDLPIAILLLFFNLFVPISIGYLAVGTAAWGGYRRHRRRTISQDVRVLSSNPMSWLAWNGRASPTCAAR